MDTRYFGDNLLALGNTRRHMTAAEEEAYYASRLPGEPQAGHVRGALPGLMGVVRAVVTLIRERRAAPSVAGPFRSAPGR